MENKNNTPAVQDTAKHTNPIKRFFSVLNGKRQKIALSVMTAISFAMVNTIYAFAESGSGTDPDFTAGDDAFFSVLGFFCTWIGRIGLVIAFVGGIMFGFSIKNDDADSKQRGLTALASGFIVFALTRSMNLFFPGVDIPLF